MLDNTTTFAVSSTETKYGVLRYVSNDQFIGPSLEKYGEYSELEAQLWRDVIAKIPQGEQERLFDIGANIGALTVVLDEIALARRDCAAIGFEPQPELFEILNENLSTSLAYNTALGDYNGTITMPRLSEMPHHNYGGISVGSGSHKVSVRTLDSFDYNNVIFMKIDVEGFEAHVIRGATETIKRCRPVMYVEADRQDKAPALLALIRSLGYRCYMHLPPLFNPNNYKGCQENLFGKIVSINVLCIPDEKVKDFVDITDKLQLAPPPPVHLHKSGWAGIVRLGGVGDNLIAASVTRPLKKMGYRVDVITQMPQAVVFENNPYVDKVSLKDPMRDLPQNNQQAWQDWFRSRSYEYDVFANLSHSCEVSLALLPSMTQYQWPAAARRKFFGGSYLEFVHDIVGVPYEFGPLFFPTEEELDHARRTKATLGNQPVVGWCITGTRPDKIHPHTPGAISRLIKELGVNVVMMGAPPPAPDFQMAKQTEEFVRLHNGSTNGLHVALSPDANNPSWPIRRILTFASVCDLVIGPDTGPMWAVAFEDVPKIMLHSHASVNNIVKHWINTTSLHAGPEVPCWPCHLLHDTPASCLEMQRKHGLSPEKDAMGAACMSSISVESIVATAAKLLKKG